MIVTLRNIVISAAALVAVGFFLNSPSPEDPLPGQALAIIEPDRDLGELLRGDHVLAFRITNASSQILRVIGMKEA